MTDHALSLDAHRALRATRAQNRQDVASSLASGLDAATDDLGVLRVVAAGSVDDGKSTLIGRLLMEAKAVLADQLAAISRSRHARAPGGALDLSLLTDGLEAEREQGITIDVAYRYFATARRKFIVADAPGHEQYTRNMATGASTAHAAIVLVDPTRAWGGPDQEAKLLAQTVRHSALLRLLGIPRVIFAVNKMDLVGYSQEAFEAIRAAAQALSDRLGIAEPLFAPVSALEGEGFGGPSAKMPWHAGPGLLPLLEELGAPRASAGAFRFPVQMAWRVDGDLPSAARALLGRAENAAVRVGQRLVALPSGREATVAEIFAPVPGGTASADALLAGQSGAIRLAEDVDLSRGDVLAAAGSAPLVNAKRLAADVCWFDDEPLALGRPYLLKLGSRSVRARARSIGDVFEPLTLDRVPGDGSLSLNGIARVELALQAALPCEAAGDAAGEGLALSSFALIDETTFRTVAAGLVREASA
jgi:sulfate adenylyltransferase subunit 1